MKKYKTTIPSLEWELCENSEGICYVHKFLYAEDDDDDLSDYCEGEYIIEHCMGKNGPYFFDATPDDFVEDGRRRTWKHLDNAKKYFEESHYYSAYND
jgi:hypothetical protein